MSSGGSLRCSARIPGRRGCRRCSRPRRFHEMPANRGCFAIEPAQPASLSSRPASPGRCWRVPVENPSPLSASGTAERCDRSVSYPTITVCRSTRWRTGGSRERHAGLDRCRDHRVVGHRPAACSLAVADAVGLHQRFERCRDGNARSGSSASDLVESRLQAGYGGATDCRPAARRSRSSPGPAAARAAPRSCRSGVDQRLARGLRPPEVGHLARPLAAARSADFRGDPVRPRAARLRTWTAWSVVRGAEPAVDAARAAT